MGRQVQGAGTGRDRRALTGVEFEKNIDNVRRATRELAVDYPVAVDSDHAIWNGFQNQYWPARYFIDASGRVRHSQFGEGDYEQSERVIRRLLAEVGKREAEHGFVSVDARGSQAPADWSNLKSPESYLGYERADGFSSEDPALNTAMAYTAPATLQLNHWALAGNWTIKPQRAALNGPRGRIAYRFHARDLNLVMGPTQGKPVRFHVLIDGQPPGASNGTDTDSAGNGTLTEQRLYQLIRQPAPIADRTFEIEFLDPGAEAFVFTFG